jgi:hypothetical protein
MGKALSSEPERIMYTFKHWFWDRNKPKATKQERASFAARLLLDPETEEPWLLIFNPNVDGKEVLKHGQHYEHSQNENEAGGTGGTHNP